MHPAVEISKVLFEVPSVVLPRDPIDPGRGLGLQRPVRLPQAIDVNVVQERSEPRVLVPCCDSRTRSSALSALTPALCPGRVLPVVFPLARSLPSTTSATATAALFGGFAGTTDLSDFPDRASQACGLGLPRASRPLSGTGDAGPPGSRAWRFRACKGLRPRRVRHGLAIAPPACCLPPRATASAPRPP